MRASLRIGLAMCGLAVASGAAHAQRDRVLRGANGQSHLRLDLGRDLTGAGHGKKNAPHNLDGLEKSRLDARRIFAAPHLDQAARLERIVAIVNERFPESDATESRYAVADAAAASSKQPLRMSIMHAKKIGLCRERSALLSALLAEGGMRSTVREGDLYDMAGTYVSQHMWVEAKVARRNVIIEPLAPQPVSHIVPVALHVHDDATGRDLVEHANQTAIAIYHPIGRTVLDSRSLRTQR